MLYDRASLSAAVACSTDNTRLELSGVNFLPDGSTQASDGHIAAWVSPAELTEDEFPMIPGMPDGPIEKSFILPGAQCTEISKGIPKKTKIQGLQAVLMRRDTSAPRYVVAGTTDLDSAQVRPTRVIDGTFPPVDNVWPADSAVEYRISFNPAKLAQLAKIAKACGSGDGLMLEFTGAGNAIRVRPIDYDHKGDANQTDRFRGLLMPLRLPKGAEIGTKIANKALRAEKAQARDEAREAQKLTEARIRTRTTEAATEAATT